jgi:PIN domain nuclease of toxin-antitoxin system
MKLLVDTHIVYWMLTEPERIKADVMLLLKNQEVQVFVSVISFMEFAIKFNIQKIEYKGGLTELFEDIDKLRLTELNIDKSHYYAYEKLPLHHRDPFDRLLIAQAISENMTIVTNDEHFKSYNVNYILNQKI